MSDNHMLDIMVDGERCPFWVESKDGRCGSVALIDGRWCKRHTTVMMRRYAKKAAQVNEQRRRDDVRRAPQLPALRARLAQVEAEMARRDPAPPTDDLAAYGGVGCSTTTRYQQRLWTDGNVKRMGELIREQSELESRIELAVAAAERLARS